MVNKMISSTRDKLFKKRSSEKSIEEQEGLSEAERIKLQFAAVFDGCVSEANESDEVSVGQNVFHQLGAMTHTEKILAKIIKTIPDNQARVITMLPHNEQGSVRHLFYLRRVSGDESITTHFKLDHTGADIERAKIEQTFSNGEGVRCKIIEVDSDGRFTDLHFDKGGEELRLTDPEVCRPDLEVVADGIHESVEDAVRHTTDEFERVVRIDQAVPLSSRIGGAAAGFKRPDKIAA